jgi:hypothetical protein
MRSRLTPLVALVILGGCGGKSSGGYGCGISAVAGQSLLLEEFTRAGKTLSKPPAEFPAALPVRIALGPAMTSVVGHVDSSIVVGLEGALPETPAVGFGVLIVNLEGKAQGVILYNGDPIRDAPMIGTVNAGERNLPLIGLMTTIANFEDPSCPVFPDSLKQ